MPVVGGADSDPGPPVPRHQWLRHGWRRPGTRTGDDHVGFDPRALANPGPGRTGASPTAGPASRQSIRDHAHRPVRSLSDHRLLAHRFHRRHRPLHQSRPIRGLERHGTGRTLLRPPCRAATLRARQPTVEPSAASRRALPDPPARSDGRAYLDRKLADAKPKKPRARTNAQISNAEGPESCGDPIPCDRTIDQRARGRGKRACRSPSPSQRPRGNRRECRRGS